MFPADLVIDAERLLEACRMAHLKIVTAESCTGGLIAGVLTEVPGSSDVVERGYVTYSNEAKMSCLGVSEVDLQRHGAVSAAVAIAMATGALANSSAQLAIAVTGVAGPGGGSPEKPVGLVHLAAARAGRPPVHRECRFGDIGRGPIRIATVREALSLLRAQLGA